MEIVDFQKVELDAVASLLAATSYSGLQRLLLVRKPGIIRTILVPRALLTRGTTRGSAGQTQNRIP